MSLLVVWFIVVGEGEEGNLYPSLNSESKIKNYEHYI